MNVYIDGENLRHRLVDILVEEKLLANSDTPFSFNLQKLLNDVLSKDVHTISYYTTRIKLPKFRVPEAFMKHIESIQELNRRWIAELTNQGVSVIKAGHLKVRQSSACIHCGKKTLLLQEKGVDVRLATDVVMAVIQDRVEQVAILSSDADMIPALQVVKRAGAKVTYICFAEGLNHAVASVADQTITYTRQQVIDVYKSENSHV